MFSHTLDPLPPSATGGFADQNQVNADLRDNPKSNWSFTAHLANTAALLCPSTLNHPGHLSLYCGDCIDDSIFFRHCGPQRLRALANVIPRSKVDHSCERLRFDFRATNVLGRNAGGGEPARPEKLIRAHW